MLVVTGGQAAPLLEVAGYTDAVKVTLDTGAVIILLGAWSATRLPLRREDEDDLAAEAARA